MLKFKTRILVCSLVAAASFLALPYLHLEEDGVDHLQTSFVGILGKVAEQGKPAPPDLSLYNVFLKKVSAPGRNSNYYTYDSSVFIKNNGGPLRDGHIVLSGDGFQKDLTLKNSPDGFSLKPDESFILENYEILFDGNYNGGGVTLNLDNQDFYELQFFELPAKIEDIQLKRVSSDGAVSISYRPSNLFLGTDDYEVYATDFLDLREANLNYKELSFDGKVHGYYVIKASESLINDAGWEKVDTLSNKGFVYVRAVNPETGYYGVSNILKLGPHSEMTRAEFAKLFVDYTGIKVFDDGESYFKDVKEDSWYAPFVQTLFNLGLADHTNMFYFPNEKITRGEVLVSVMDHFDADLVVAPGKSRFEDISGGNFIYHYTQALYKSGKASAFGDYFNQHLPATNDYLKHLVNAYK